MKIPEFIAEASLYTTSNRYRSLRFDSVSSQGPVVILQRGGSGFEGLANCINDCVDQNLGTPRQCSRMCRSSTHGSCTPRDNSAHRQMCLGGADLWELAEIAVCKLAPWPASLACAAGVHELAARLRDDCDPAVICT